MKCCCCKNSGESQLVRLYINIVEARTLLPSDINGWSDPFVKVSIGNSKFKQIYKSNYVERTLNPKWNETFIHFYNADKDLYQSSLRFQIYDHDAVTSDLLGSVDIPLAPYSDHKWIEQWHKLRILDNEGHPLRCRGYIRLKIQCVLPNQYSFLTMDKSDQTNIHDTRTDSFDTHQEKINEITKQNQINSAQAEIQQRKQMTFNKNITEQARKNNSQNPIQMSSKRSKQNMPKEQQEPLLQEQNLAEDQMQSVDLRAPSNPQYDHIRPVFQDSNQQVPPS